MTFGRKGLGANPAPQAGPQPAPAFTPGGRSVEGPLFDAIQYVGMVSPPGAYLTHMANPQLCMGPNQMRGLRYDIMTNEGAGYAFLFPSFASIWLNAEPAPRPQIPTEMIANRVPGYAAEIAELG